MTYAWRNNSRILSFAIILTLLPGRMSTSVMELSPADEFQRTVLSNLPPCPINKEPYEHDDMACDRVAQNDPSVRKLRMKRHHEMLQTFSASQISDERTWTCPNDDEDDILVHLDKNVIIGTETRWIVQNASSGPVLVSFFDAKKGREFSAIDGSYPAENDPKAIILPNHWLSINVFQGHIFNVWEILNNTNTDKISLGRVLLRHRPGLIDIRNRMGGSDWNCPASAFDDPAPNEQILHDFSRPTPPQVSMERCNIIHQGFINRVGCPIDLYFAGSAPDSGRSISKSPITSQQQNCTDNTSSSSDKRADECSATSSVTCQEVFKMHLGVNLSTKNYLDEWTSPVKFEGTYLSHKFVARLRHDPSVVVDEIVISKDIVKDCSSDAIPEIYGASTVMEPVKDKWDLRAVFQIKHSNATF